MSRRSLLATISVPTLVAAGAVAATVAVAPPAAALTPAPKTIPAIRQWAGASGTYSFGANTRIAIGAAGLATTAEVLAADVRSLTGVPVPTTTDAPRPGDIALRLGGLGDPGPTPNAHAEAYRLTVGPSITITGQTDTGVFNGTRTVLQLLHQGATIGYGTASDWPTFTERGLLVDLGRKFMSLPWLRAEIRELAYLKLNLLHLHLSDVNGFRLQSDTHPEVVSTQHYTKAEIRALIAYAAGYHVQIVPEIDLPGHADPILAAHPELRLVDQNGTAQSSLIDLSNPASYRLIKDLIEEYLPLFPGKYWHIGADEYLTDYSPYPRLLAYARARYGPAATAKDAFYGYINWADALVRAKGKTARAWNDGLDGDGTVSVNPDVVVDHWSAEGVFGLPWVGPALAGPQLVAAGHLVQNDAFTPTYYTTGLGGALVTAPTAAIYDAWDPGLFVDGNRVNDPAHNLGSMVSLWFNDPSPSESEATAAIHDRLRAMAQQTWGSPKPDLLYLLFALRISAVGDAPA